MTILLVNPWIHDFAAYDFWSKPLGLLTIASILRAQGFDVRYFDCLDPYHEGTFENCPSKKPKRTGWGSGKYSKEEIRKPAALQHVARRYSRYGIAPALFEEELRAIPVPDAVFVTSMMTYWYPGVFETIALVKKVLPFVPVVLGGNYATLCHGHAVALSGADFVITGEAEPQLPFLLERLTGRDISGMISSDPAPAESPYPAYDLIRHLDQVALMTSRGCPFSCSYCASAYLNPLFRARDPIDVVEEIQYWNRRGIVNFSFYDDALLIDRKRRIIPMLQEILRRKLSLSFHCPNGLHIRSIDEELADLMFRAGFKTIRFGFESADSIRQIETGGKVDNDETERAVKILKKAGYEGSDIGMYILCGLPGQKASEVADAVEFIGSLGARPVIAEYSPIPHTALWNESVAASAYDIANEPLYHNNTLLPCGGDTMTYDEYRRLKNRAQRYRL
ncbi:MAG: B12-binding domain-containing radical SAM protein [Syntrophales bacterium]|nr:B12-binding domain-containing radical SAM protein [Syntrophales bacterium]MDY0045576.1 radical SAM protein [Syntrophales bacterium]